MPFFIELSQDNNFAYLDIVNNGPTIVGGQLSFNVRANIGSLSYNEISLNGSGTLFSSISQTGSIFIAPLDINSGAIFAPGETIARIVFDKQAATTLSIIAASGRLDGLLQSFSFSDPLAVTARGQNGGTNTPDDDTPDAPIPPSNDDETGNINGRPVVGSVLEFNPDSIDRWTKASETTAEYQWYRDGEPIENADGRTYEITPQDEDATLSVRVSYLRDDGQSVTARPNAIEVVDGATPTAVFNGTDSSDLIEGRRVDDALDGQAGRDTILGSGGDDFINGGTGRDVLIYDAPSSNYTISITRDKALFIADRTDATGSDDVLNVELVQFADGTLDVNDIMGAVRLKQDEFSDLVALYTAVLNRAADAGGLYFWADKYAEGLTLREMTEFFFLDDEAQSLYADEISNADFVRTVYENVLGRSADATGLSFWTSELNVGRVTRPEFIYEFLQGLDVSTSAADVSYVNDKTDLSIYFSVILGMSDTDDARDVFIEYGTQRTSDLVGAVALIDDIYSDAVRSSSGDLLVNLSGILETPFPD